MLFDLKDYENKKVHFIGIGGVSMSGLAAVLLNSGIRVTGSDFRESPALDRLREKGAEIVIGHGAENITDQDVVVYTAAIPSGNPELEKARSLGIPLFDRAAFLGQIIRNFTQSISVAGTHGKTSTTSMLSAIALAGPLDPTILVGGYLPLIHGNYRIGDGDLFITEACEYKESFLKFPGKVALILNVEADHLDYYRDLSHILDTFRRYIAMTPEDGTVVANADDPNMAFILKDAPRKLLTFGIEGGMLKARNLRYDRRGNPSFEVHLEGRLLFPLTLKVPGRFNVLNALGAVGAALSSGIPADTIRAGLEGYKGVDKRFQVLYEAGGVTVIDDYAHHPSEIRAAVDTAATFQHRRIHVVFQPHTYTRTKSFFAEFAAAFDEVDSLVVLPIYAAREPDTGLVSSEDLVQAIAARGTVPVRHAESFEAAAKALAEAAGPGDIILTMGAGEAVKVADLLHPLLSFES